jgi:hypothetical protein
MSALGIAQLATQVPQRTARHASCTGATRMPVRRYTRTPLSRPLRYKSALYQRLRATWKCLGSKLSLHHEIVARLEMLETAMHIRIRIIMIEYSSRIDDIVDVCCKEPVLADSVTTALLLWDPVL